MKSLALKGMNVWKPLVRVSNETITQGLFQTVLSGGTTNSITIAPQGEQDVYGTANATVISTGGLQYIYQGLASGTVISDGGYEGDYATDIGTVVLSGGQQDVFGTTSNAVVSDGGIEIVEAGATASGTTVLSGGEIVIYDGANVSGLTVSSGGIEVFVSSGGFFSPMAASRSFALQTETLAPSSKVATTPTTAASTAVDSTLANLIQAMAGFATGSSTTRGALFENVSSGLLGDHTSALAGAQHFTSGRLS